MKTKINIPESISGNNRHMEVIRHFNILFSERFKTRNDDGEMVLDKEVIEMANKSLERPIKRTSKNPKRPLRAQKTSKAQTHSYYVEEYRAEYEKKDGGYGCLLQEVDSRISDDKPLLKSQQEKLHEWNRDIEREGWKVLMEFFTPENNCWRDKEPATLIEIINAIRLKLEEAVKLCDEKIAEMIDPMLLHKKQPAEWYVANFLGRSSADFVDHYCRKGIYESELKRVRRIILCLAFPLKSKTIHNPEWSLGNKYTGESRWGTHELVKIVRNRLESYYRDTEEDIDHWSYVQFILEEIAYDWKEPVRELRRAQSDVLDGSRSTCEHHNYSTTLNNKAKVRAWTDVCNLWGFTNGRDYNHAGTFSITHKDEKVNEWYRELTK